MLYLVASLTTLSHLFCRDMLSAKKEVDVIVEQLQESAAREKAKNEFIYNQLNKAIMEKQKSYDEVSVYSVTV